MCMYMCSRHVPKMCKLQSPFAVNAEMVHQARCNLSAVPTRFSSRSRWYSSSTCSTWPDQGTIFASLVFLPGRKETHHEHIRLSPNERGGDRSGLNMREVIFPTCGQHARWMPSG